jgi:hypothetical protein
MNSVIVLPAIIAIIEFIKRFVPGLTGAWTILLAAILGGIAGILGFEGLNVVTGIAVGLAASGVHQVASAAGGK